jgi:hypothetical protein
MTVSHSHSTLDAAIAAQPEREQLWIAAENKVKMPK